jgi:hypothetical protein
LNRPLRKCTSSRSNAHEKGRKCTAGCTGGMRLAWLGVGWKTGGTLSNHVTCKSKKSATFPAFPDSDDPKVRPVELDRALLPSSFVFQRQLAPPRWNGMLLGTSIGCREDSSWGCICCLRAQESADLELLVLLGRCLCSSLSQLAAIRARAPAPVCPRPALRPARHASGAGASAETAVAPAHAPRPVAVPSFSEKEVQLFSKNR